ncbi:hypothetical protein SO802_000302 [Lithocarpus litseifolius]|uniref:non-specific serine/threonine protein kinase n=1 Tax=Lithocarpus litseifolius TaxID=425828 RepID=A0AAW2DRK5_9ROSI
MSTSVGFDPTSEGEILESPGQGEVNPRELESEIKKKRGQYQSDLQPFYQLCKMNEVKLEVQFAAGFRPCQVAVEEAQKYNARWVVLDSHFKKFKEDIRGHINCNLAVVKGKDIAAIMTSTAVQNENFETLPPEEESPGLLSDPESPCWYPRSWRSGFPQAFDHSELKVVTNDFDDYNIVREEDGMKVYHGFFQDIPVLVKCFLKTDKRFWSTLKILFQVRHRHIMNFVGYCYADDSVFLLCDCPCMDTVEVNLQWKSQNLEEDEHLYVDVHDYGMFLLELITGKSARCFQAQGKGPSLVNWATPLLENGSLSQLMDHRLTDSSDMEVVNHMENAALCCLKNVKGRRLSMSEVLAVVRGDELALSKYGFLE